MKRTSRLSQKHFQLSSLRFQQSYISRQVLKLAQTCQAWVEQVRAQVQMQEAQQTTM